MFLALPLLLAGTSTTKTQLNQPAILAISKIVLWQSFFLSPGFSFGTSQKGLAPPADGEMCKASSPPIPGYFSLSLGALGLRPVRMYYFETKCISQKTQAECHCKDLFYIFTQVSGPTVQCHCCCPSVGAVLPLEKSCFIQRLPPKHVGKTTFTDPEGYFALMAFGIMKIHFSVG